MEIIVQPTNMIVCTTWEEPNALLTLLRILRASWRRPPGLLLGCDMIEEKTEIQAIVSIR